jgi:hypothetical protein
MSNKLSEVIWEEVSGIFKFGVSERFSMYSFVLFDNEIVLFDTEVENLYLILKDVVASWSNND